MSDLSKRAENSSTSAGDDRLTSEDLAALIIDALLRANIIRNEHVERGLKIATEEINVRKAMGDY